ncbi:hypothetical protein [Facklamia sp. 7083-14-GEN3]|uniref:hypothetical protein n=1 Tax=Facklamia sp. 7083-14-GEN3 TaxID=2973478 RepID=UPI00215C7151|nr:hypothetical protein [Facklamia sp. 7083-14-GEN3]MCR8968466.1 hypothetical protein [Facklamia sp. 7083-14-GEN3]
MSKMINQHGKELFNHYDFEAWSIEERLEFLQATIEMRIKQLRKKINPRFLTSANVVNRRLKLPLQCYQEIKSLKENKSLDSKELLKSIEKIESQFFGALEVE